jgi:hypothetical protein
MQKIVFVFIGQQRLLSTPEQHDMVPVETTLSDGVPSIT